jgi:Holliday junction resolvasome RuvABC endonuclease subunit
MNMLALDLGTRMGWALLQTTEMLSGSVSFATNKRAGFGVRFLNFRNWLVEMLGGTTTASKHKIDMVVFEDVRNHAGVYAAHVYGGFVAILTSVCEALKIPYRGFGVKTIKKFITGSGNASKQDVINAVQTRGWKPIDDNEADAIALALLAENTLMKENTIMYSNNIGRSTNNYFVEQAFGAREVKIRNAKNEISGKEILAGPYKYSQVTGKSTPDSR